VEQAVRRIRGSPFDPEDAAETDTGRLYSDADGTGAGGRIHFATVDAGLALTNADFVVI
jgi:hypothetical protein